MSYEIRPALLTGITSRSFHNLKILSVLIRHDIKLAIIIGRRILMILASWANHLPFSKRRVGPQITHLIHRRRTRTQKEHLLIARTPDARSE